MDARKMSLLLLLGLLLLSVDLSHQQIPMNMLMKLKDMKNAADFMDTMLAKKPAEDFSTPVPPTGVEPGRPGQEIPPPVGVEKPAMEDVIFTAQGSIDPLGRDVVAGMLADEDGCTPKIRSMQIPPHSDPNVVYWPTCTPMEQCGGCCGHDMLECAPTVATTETIQVLKARYPYPGAERFVFEGMMDIPMDRHLTCECRCRIQPYHCHPMKQRYEADSCSCRCLNEDQATNCPSHQRWDEQQCACMCPTVYQCRTDEYFDNTTCRCEIREDGGSTEAPKPTLAQIILGDPCLNHACRPGYVATRVNADCECQLPRRVPDVDPNGGNNSPAIVVPGSLPQHLPPSGPTYPQRPPFLPPGVPTYPNGPTYPGIPVYPYEPNARFRSHEPVPRK